MKPSLKINFAHFWPHFNKEDNIFTNLLRKHFDVKIDALPDLLIFTNDYAGTREYLNYTCHKLFVGLENERTDFYACDFAIDFDYLNNPNHLRLPLWALWDLTALSKPKNFGINDIQYRKDCCMVVSNGNAKERIKFFQKLSKYIHIDSGGKYLNNVCVPVKDKMEFIKNYKFVISFENSSRAGYSTEKLVEPMLANTIPIYWGDTTIGEDFNTDSFINIHDYASEEDAIQDILSLVQNNESYIEMLNRPWFNDEAVSSIKYHKLLEQFLLDSVVLISKTTPVSKTYKARIHYFNLKKGTLKALVKSKLKLNFR
jgi:hypothetical protein